MLKLMSIFTFEKLIDQASQVIIENLSLPNKVRHGEQNINHILFIL